TASCPIPEGHMSRDRSPGRRKPSEIWVPKRLTDDMNRRSFVRTAGGILLLGGLDACGDTGGPGGASRKGTIHVVITGLSPSATSGGSVTGTAPGVTG